MSIHRTRRKNRHIIRQERRRLIKAHKRDIWIKSVSDSVRSTHEYNLAYSSRIFDPDRSNVILQDKLWQFFKGYKHNPTITLRKGIV